MGIIVQKYGGTSLATIDLIKKAAKRIVAEVNLGNKIVVVVSAMAGETDKLSNYAMQVSNLSTENELAEYDAVLSSAEQVTAGLLALELMTLGKKARSWQAWQVPIITDNRYSNATIEFINSTKLLSLIDHEEIPVICGFQGCSSNDRLTTLGRGGSDTSAVAIAAAINADICMIYTDVDGVYTIDPKMANNAIKLHHIAANEILEMASNGAKVLQTTSVVLAMQYNVPMVVASSFDNNQGTLISNNDMNFLPKTVTSIITNDDEAHVTISSLSLLSCNVSWICNLIANHQIYFDLLTQNIVADNKSNIYFTIKKTDISKLADLLEKNSDIIKYQSIAIDENVTKIAIIGIGMLSKNQVITMIFEVFANHQIEILLLSTTEIKICFLVQSVNILPFIQELYLKFNLVTNQIG